LAEGIQVDHMQSRHEEIKAYIRSLAIGEVGEPDNVNLSRVSSPPSYSPTMSVIPERRSPVPTSLSDRNVTELVEQFSSLFEPRAIRRPSLVGIIVDGASVKQTLEKAAMIETKQHQPILHKCSAPPARKDSMNLTPTSLVSRLSTAMANMAFSVSLQNKPYSSRPPPLRSSSAVFRGLANEERATGD